jgi:hypothetical protein
MKDELRARQRAIHLRLAHFSVMVVFPLSWWFTPRGCSWKCPGWRWFSLPARMKTGGRRIFGLSLGESLQPGPGASRVGSFQFCYYSGR